MSGSAIPLPINMNAFIVGQIMQMQAMLGYSQAMNMMQIQYSDCPPQYQQPTLLVHPAFQPQPLANFTGSYPHPYSFLVPPNFHVYGSPMGRSSDTPDSASPSVVSSAGQSEAAAASAPAANSEDIGGCGKISESVHSVAEHGYNYAEKDKRKNKRYKPTRGSGKENKSKSKTGSDAEVEAESAVVVDLDQPEGPDDLKHEKGKEANDAKVEDCTVFMSEPEHDLNLDLDLDLESRQMRELRLIAELRQIAMSLKKRIIRRFKRERGARMMRPTNNQSPRETAKLENKCNYPNCSFATKSNRGYRLHEHIGTHYPDAYFCPVCHETFPRLDTFGRHLRRRELQPAGSNYDLDLGSAPRQNKQRRKQRKRTEEVTVLDSNILPLAGSCVESEEALHFEVARNKERFNIYYLGVMEDFEMSEEHFEILAGRRRGDLDLDWM